MSTQPCVVRVSAKSPSFGFPEPTVEGTQTHTREETMEQLASKVPGDILEATHVAWVSQNF